MTRVRLAAVLGVALLIVLSVWAVGAVVARRPPLDLGPAIVVPTALESSVTPQVVRSSPEEGPTPLPEPSVSPPVMVTTSAPTSTRPSEAVPVSKPPAPMAGDDDDDVLDDDDDPFDDDTDDDIPDDDGDGG